MMNTVIGIAVGAYGLSVMRRNPVLGGAIAGGAGGWLLFSSATGYPHGMAYATGEHPPAYYAGANCRRNQHRSRRQHGPDRDDAHVAAEGSAAAAAPAEPHRDQQGPTPQQRRQLASYVRATTAPGVNPADPRVLLTPLEQLELNRGGVEGDVPANAWSRFAGKPDTRTDEEVL